MKVIKNVELIETDKDWFEYFESEGLPNFLDSSDISPFNYEIKRKVVTGRRFCKYENGEIKDEVIGFSDEAAEVLGFAYEAWNEKDKEMERIKNKAKRMEKILERKLAWEKMPVFKKIYLFVFDKAKYESLKYG